MSKGSLGTTQTKLERITRRRWFFLINPAELRWNGGLHLPLLSISLYAFVLPYRKGLSEVVE
jgi:hypothetical protein